MDRHTGSVAVQFRRLRERLHAACRQRDGADVRSKPGLRYPVRPRRVGGDHPKPDDKLHFNLAVGARPDDWRCIAGVSDCVLRGTRGDAHRDGCPVGRAPPPRRRVCGRQYWPADGRHSEAQDRR